MRGRFDDEDERLERQRPSRDTELTLGTGTLLLLFLGLALICGACFGLGYEVGRGVTQPAAAGQQGAGIGQAGAQSSGSKAKPSATMTPGPPAPSPNVVVDANRAASGNANGTGNPTASSKPTSSMETAQTVVTQTNATPAQPQVRPALPAYGAPLPSGDSGMHAVLPPPVQLMVQIAAVSHQEDADVLSAALRKHGYAVVEKRDPMDGLIHIRIGPFNSRSDADRWRQKLLDDGYNAMIQ